MFTRQPWRYRLTLSDVFHNDDLTIEQKRDEIVKQIRASRFYDDEDYDLVEIVDELADVDRDFFDHVWDAFYDWADEHRVWVETF